MVLVSNEWQSKAEDEKKLCSSAVTTTTGAVSVAGQAAAAALPATTSTTTATAAITSTRSPAIAATVGKASLPSCPPATAATDITITAAATNSINCETLTRRAADPVIAALKKESTDPSDYNNDNDNANSNSNNELLSLYDKIAGITGTNNNDLNRSSDIKELSDPWISEQRSQLKIMAENSKESSFKDTEDGSDLSSLENSNNITSLINSLCSSDAEIKVKDLNEANCPGQPDSNTNTLQPSVTVKTQSTQNTKSVGGVLMPHALNSALQSALCATTPSLGNNNSTAAAGLQPSFLSQLAMTAHMADLPKAVKHLNKASFGAGEATQSKNDSNVLEANSSAASLSISPVPGVESNSNGQAKILLICEGNSHPFQARTIYLTPNVECMVGRLIAKSKTAENNAIFDCKVLSRKHAVIWYTPDGKFLVKDTKSSNGTFINDVKLQGEEEAELHSGDIVKFGVDVVENSRKEVHGCIIACVKLYLPDGREAISIDSPSHRSQYSGEGRISYDDLHRLNVYIQETSQREQVLASKLCAIQNVLESTRKNSALCWQSMITEDQLLHRIHSLEKKLSFMEKNVPENILRNEVLKLLDEKNSYQHSAKEALRKVYQERCDALQMFAKMESAYKQSGSECALLRDQIANSEQMLQDLNGRLISLETEYNEHRDESMRQQQEAKEHEEQRINELTEKLQERELECEQLRKKMSELLLKRAKTLEDEEQLLEKQAIEKLDAAIADMDLGDDDDDDEDDDDIDFENDIEDGQDDGGVNVGRESKANGNDSRSSKLATEGARDAANASPDNQRASPPSIPASLSSIFGDSINGPQTADTTTKTVAARKKGKTPIPNSIKKSPKRVKESTIMKWLQNSDLKKNEGSLDIFKAICNENEEDEDPDNDANACDSSDDDVDDEAASKKLARKDVMNSNNKHFVSILRNVEQNLKQLEQEIASKAAEDNRHKKANEKRKAAHTDVEGGSKTSDSFKDVYNFDENSDEEQEVVGALALAQSNGGEQGVKSSYKVLSANNKKYLLLKTSVNMLREAFNEIRETVKDQPKSALSLPGSPIEKGFADEAYLDTDSISEVESLSRGSPVYSSHSTIKQAQQKEPHSCTATETSNNVLLQDQLKEYQQQVGKLSKQLQQTELEAQQTLEIMQIECDDVKQKMHSLNQVIDGLQQDKRALEQVINENKNNTTRMQQEDNALDTSRCEEIIDSTSLKSIEAEIEDNDLASINVTALEREEELITYKERLEEKDKELIEMRNEMVALRQKTDGSVTVRSTTSDVLLKRVLPYGFVVLAIVVYFITTYF